MKQNTIFLFCFGIDDVLQGSSKVAGIQVQMSYWARTFVKHGWEVYALSRKGAFTLEGIHFLQTKSKTSWLSRHGLSIIVEPIEAMRLLRKTKADVVFVRGERRDLYSIKHACDFNKAKLVFLGASDYDFEPGKEFIQGSEANIKLYRKGVRKISYFITQNQQQADNLFRHYGKKSIVIPNIWPMNYEANHHQSTYDAVWVANLRRLKRAEWFVNLAQQLPQYKFAIVGGVNEQDYYDHIKTLCKEVPNLDFLGPQPLNFVNQLMGQSKLLVCTSEYEGFPNTFLQAWAFGVPIVSTVNPSCFITKFGLGEIIGDENQLLQSVSHILSSSQVLEEYRQNIKSYFASHHDTEMAYQKVMELINEE